MEPTHPMVLCNTPIGPISLQNLTLLRNCLLLRLPSYTEKEHREQNNFSISTLAQVKYDPSRGKVEATGPEVTHTRKGDTVFFNRVSWEAAKDNAFDTDDERFVGLDHGNRCFAIKATEESNTVYYMILPEDQLWLIERPTFCAVVHEKALPNQLLPVNGHILCAPIKSEGTLNTETGLTVIENHEENYRLNMATVCVAHEGSDLAAGDMVYTLKNCDMYLEEPLNNPNLPEDYFIIEDENIFSKITTMNNNTTYQARGKRIIIQPDPQTNQTETGLINTEADRFKLLTGVVVSVGEEVKGLEAGYRVIYARNSGIKLPPLDGTGHADENMDLLAITSDDVFAVVQDGKKVVEKIIGDSDFTTSDTYKALVKGIGTFQQAEEAALNGYRVATTTSDRYWFIKDGKWEQIVANNGNKVEEGRFSKENLMCENWTVTL